MKIISHEDIVDLNIDSTMCMQWVIHALKIKEKSFLPAKCSIKPQEGVFFTSMPCLIPELDVYGLKMVSRIPNMKPALNSTMMLFRYSTGELLSVIDCNWITAQRTGAVATLSALKMVKSDFKSIGCIGLGNTCEATLDILLPNYSHQKLKLRLLKYKNHTDRIIKRYQHYENIVFEVVETKEELIKNSDIILSCVTSVSENMGKDEWYQEGCTVIPVHTMGFQNCDLFFDKVIIDDYDHVKNFKYYNKFKKVIEIKDTLDYSSVRENDKERLIAYNVGIALHDVYFAYKIYDMLKDKKQDVMYQREKSKYWL